MKVSSNTIKTYGSFVLRSGAVIGVIYGMKQAGVWDSAEGTENLYEKLKSNLGPRAKQLIERYPEKTKMLTKLTDMPESIRQHYNNGVKGTFHVMTMLPANMEALAKRAFEVCKEKRSQMQMLKIKLKPSVRNGFIVTNADENSNNGASNLGAAVEQQQATENLEVETKDEQLTKTEGSEMDVLADHKQQLLILTSAL